MASSKPIFPDNPPRDALTSEERERHSRHILLRDIGLAGVKKIRRARVAVIGAGGLASSLLTYLSVSGIGEITVIDYDTVTASNLGRQFLFQKEDVGQPKAEVAAWKLRRLNPEVSITPLVERISEKNFSRLIASVDVVAETVDSTANKLMIHDLCLHHRFPLIHAAALAMEGQLLTILPGKSPCLRCFFPDLGIVAAGGGLPWEEESDSCSVEGVFSPLCGMMGSLQAAEVIRFFTHPQELRTRLLHIDLSRYLFRSLTPHPCSHCGFTHDDPNR